jgi:hypothetical protein
MSRSRIVALENFQQFTAINVLSDPGHIPGPIVIPNCIQVNLMWTQDDGKQAVNVLHARVPGTYTPTVGQANGLLGLMGGDLFNQGILGHMPATSALAAVHMRDLRAPMLPFILSDGPTHPGTSIAAALPNEVAIVLTEKTGLSGPSNRGRIYLPNWDASAVAAGNVIDPSLVNDLTGLGAMWMASFAASGLTMCIGQPARAAYTGSTGRDHPARPAGTVDVTQVVCRDNHFDTQRKRGLR